MTQEKAIQEAKTLREKILAKISSIEHRTIGNEGKFAGRLADSLVTLFQEQYASSSSEKGDTTEMALCEIDHLILHEDQLYRFKKHEGCKGCEEYNGVTHQSSKQFSISAFTKWLFENNIEFVCGEFFHASDYDGNQPLDEKEIFNKYMQTATPKEHSEGEGREV